MHIHILGICGTFMGSLAILARQAGHTVTGCDQNVYPPMSTHLEKNGITLYEGFDIHPLSSTPDCYIIGNVMKRGAPILEHILNERLPFYSGPQWFGEHFLRNKQVLAVSGTHGKTTTASILTWILECAQKNPSFLIGGIVQNFDTSSRWCEDSPYFVIEADEYDTAFFDKRSKFLHYFTQHLIINNIEFDHADIFADLAAIETQFHHLIRTLPSTGSIIYSEECTTSQRVLQKGSWSPTIAFGPNAAWSRSRVAPDNSFTVLHEGVEQGVVEWGLSGEHNASNALAAIIAAHQVHIPPAVSMKALRSFKGIKRRMEVRGCIQNITVYDDFAHHPTAIATTLAGAHTAHPEARILAVFEPRSNTMKLGTMLAQLPAAFACAQEVFCYAPETQAISQLLPNAFADIQEKTHIHTDLSQMITQIIHMAEPFDHIIIMSNGGFGNIHEKILLGLQQKYQ